MGSSLLGKMDFLLAFTLFSCVLLSRFLAVAEESPTLSSSSSTAEPTTTKEEEEDEFSEEDRRYTEDKLPNIEGPPSSPYDPLAPIFWTTVPVLALVVLVLLFFAVHYGIVWRSAVAALAEVEKKKARAEGELAKERKNLTELIQKEEARKKELEELYLKQQQDIERCFLKYPDWVYLRLMDDNGFIESAMGRELWKPDMTWEDPNDPQQARAALRKKPSMITLGREEEGGEEKMDEKKAKPREKPTMVSVGRPSKEPKEGLLSAPPPAPDVPPPDDAAAMVEEQKKAQPSEDKKPAKEEKKKEK